MSLNTKLRALKSVLSEILNKANEVLVEKGKEPANNIDMALDDIASLPSGDDTLSRIALESPTEEEKGTVDLKLDSSWGNLKPYAFYSNKKLKSVDLSDCVNMTDLPSNCFNAATYMESFKFPPNVKTLGDRVCGANNTMKELVFPASVETMGTECFREAKAVENITFEPDGKLLTLGASAFRSIWKLKKIDFGTTSKIRTINEYAFSDCRASSGKFEIWLPPCLKTISYTVFSSSNAQKVYFRNKVKSWNRNGGFNANHVNEIYVPWSKGEVAGAPWGAKDSDIYYDFKMFNHIEITTPPNNLAFAVGESFDPTGMTVTFFETDESVDAKMTEIPIENLEFSQEPFTNDDLGEEVPFYIYYTAEDGSRYIADIEINIRQA